MTAPKATLSSPPPSQSPEDLTPIKTATCPSLTGTTKISYKIAIDTSPTDSSSNLYFQILKNSNTGKFSEEWIAYNDAKSALPIGPFSSAPLRALYRNKSLNTPGFLLAALLNEDIVEREPGKQLLFRFKSDKAFMAEMEELAGSVAGVSAVANSGKPGNAGNLKSRKTGASGSATTSTT